MKYIDSVFAAIPIPVRPFICHTKILPASAQLGTYRYIKIITSQREVHWHNEFNINKINYLMQHLILYNTYK